MVSSGKQRVSSGGKRPSAQSAQGHIYEIKKVDSDKYYLNNDGSAVRVTVTLFDVTRGKTITRRGVSRMMGNFSPIWLDSLEGRRSVYVAVEECDQRCKLVKATQSGQYSSKPDYWLKAI